MSSPNNFDDFFNDDIEDLGDLPDFSDNSMASDDNLLLDEDLEEDEGGGPSNTFKILLGFLAVIFVVLVGVVAALFLTQGEECDANCLLATQITSDNQTTEANIRASETALSIGATETQVAVETLNAQATETAISVATSDQATADAIIAATDTQTAIDATNTQVAVETSIAATQTAERPTDTPTVEVVVEQPTEETVTEIVAQIVNTSGTPVPSGYTVCIFRDSNGDGVFNPSENVANPNCSPTIGQGTGTDTTSVTSPSATEEAQPSGETVAPAGPTLNPIFQTATAVSGGGGGTGADTTNSGQAAPAATQPAANPLNPIFQTATAQAAANSGGSVPPTPTPEGSSRQGQMMARLIQDPQNEPAPQQDGGGEDEFVTGITVDENGNITVPSLPPGDYFFTVGSEQFQINVKDTVGDQVFTFPSTGDTGPFTITVKGSFDTGGAQVTPGRCTISPIFCTATALAGAGQASATPTLEPGVPTEVPKTGFFDGDSDSVGSVDLIVLGLIGMVLVGVVVAARRMRATA